MARWELGQDIIYIADILADKIYDINKAGHKELAIKLDLIRAQLGDLFNEYNAHDFEIFDSDSLVAMIVNYQEPRTEAKRIMEDE